MRVMNFIRKYSGTAFAFVALLAAQAASTQFSYIYYQNSLPKKVKEFNKCRKTVNLNQTKRKG